MTLKGVAWRMSDSTGSLILAVIERYIVMADRQGTWRSGVYGNVRDADSYAAKMTKDCEGSGMQLSAGPVEFTTEFRVADADAVGTDILAALAGNNP